MFIRRGRAGARPANTVDIRELENRLREAGCSRSQAKKLVARAKVVEKMSEDELRDAAGEVNFPLREAVNEPSDMVNELMERINKLTH